YLALHVNDQDKFLQINAKMKKFDRWRDFVLQIFWVLVIVSLVIWGAARFGGRSTYYTNWIAAFALALFPTVEAFASLPTAAQETNIYKDSLKRLNNLPAPDRTKHKPIKLTAPFNLVLTDVHYAYPQTNKEVLHGINLNIHDGEKIAILGRSGAGKSTLAALLRGDRVPAKGHVTLNGIDTSKFGDQMSNYFSIINQTPYLFNTTIANNLRLGNEDATDEQLWDVLRRVGLAEMVQKLTDGLDTKVDEAGLRFSGGERHRLALARILLKNTPIVLLDEPTVGLDPITEQAVINMFIKELSGKTLIWITHHLQGIDQMDQVIFIEDGQINMQGTPEKLWQTEPRYRELKKADLG
ncbi:amino acid ABC transporter ATP-binding/permease protein, partial [Lactobacillus crispatus]